MPGFSQIIRPWASAAVSGDAEAGGYGRSVAGLSRQALLAPADPGTPGWARRSGEQAKARA